MTATPWWMNRTNGILEALGASNTPSQARPKVHTGALEVLTPASGRTWVITNQKSPSLSNLQPAQLFQASVGARYGEK